MITERNVDGIRIVAIIVGNSGKAETLNSLAGQKLSVLNLGRGCGDLDESSATAPQLFNPDETVWLLPLAAGDMLSENAAQTYRSAALHAQTTNSTKVIYADDDLIDDHGRRYEPHFKPDWNSELFAHFDYLTGACIIRMTYDEVCKLHLYGSNGVESVSGEAMARLIKKHAEAEAPLHIREILHHRRTRPMPKISTFEADAKSVHLYAGLRPTVSIIIPTRNCVDLLRECISGLDRTSYSSMEVLVVDNGSDDPETLAYLSELNAGRCKVLRDDGIFNYARLNNIAVRESRGELLCLLNNDVEVIDPDWLSIMAAQAQRPEVGAVGAQLLYPDGRIQHAGVVLGICGGAAHAHRMLQPDEIGYFSRHRLPQFVSAVTAACLVVRRDKFDHVGGLDEDNFAVAFNDVDLCMRLNAQGWQSFYEPRARLIHHESVSRGLDRDVVGAARFARELQALDQAWGTRKSVDPFHHPYLSPYSEQFVCGL